MNRTYAFVLFNEQRYPIYFEERNGYEKLFLCEGHAAEMAEYREIGTFYEIIGEDNPKHKYNMEINHIPQHFGMETWEFKQFISEFIVHAKTNIVLYRRDFVVATNKCWSCGDYLHERYPYENCKSCSSSRRFSVRDRVATRKRIDRLHQLTYIRDSTRRLEPIYSLRSPEGELVELRHSDIKSFCTSNALSLNTFYHLINGETETCKEWVMYDEFSPFVKKLQAPDDTIHELVNIKEFCLKHDLPYYPIRNVLSGERKFYLGWRLPVESNNR